MKNILFSLFVCLFTVLPVFANSTLKIFEVVNKSEKPVLVKYGNKSLINIAEDIEYLYFAQEPITFSGRNNIDFWLYLFPKQNGINDNMHFRTFISVYKSNGFTHIISGIDSINQDNIYNHYIDTKFIETKIKNILPNTLDTLFEFKRCKTDFNKKYCYYVF